jgi:ribose transport system substrate-binding protein
VAHDQGDKPVKNRSTLVVLVGMLGLAIGCGRSDAPPQSQAKAKGRQFAVTFQVMNNPFFPELDRGIREVVEAHGDTLITLDAQFDSTKQMNDISDMVQGQVAGLFINPVNWKSIRGSLLKAQQKNIPCIIVDAPAEDAELAVCTVASDNVKAGRLAAEALVKARRPAKIVILHHPVNKACLDRVAGFREVIAKYPDMQVLDTQEGKGTIEGSRPVMRDLVGRYPELNAVFAINDPSALGAISALESAGKLAGVTLVTVDGSQKAIDEIKAGRLFSSSAQFPREIGRIAAEKMYDHLAGKPVEREVVVRVEVITKENADSLDGKNY